MLVRRPGLKGFLLLVEAVEKGPTVLSWFGFLPLNVFGGSSSILDQPNCRESWNMHIHI
jgi:hypothetical protein